MGLKVEDPNAPLECCGRTFDTHSGLASHQRSPRKCAQHPDFDPDAERGPSQATILIGLATDADDVEYWHDADMVAWATVPVADHVEHHRVRTRPFKTWLRHRYYATEGASPSSQAVQDTVDHLDGIACFDGDQHDTHVRIAGQGGAVYLDLCDADWRIVEVTATGWRVITAADAPVRFRRRNGMLPLPVPQTGGKLKLLADLVNVADRDRPLVVGCLVDMLRPGRGHPVLWLQGEHGFAKTTTRGCCAAQSTRTRPTSAGHPATSGTCCCQPPTRWWCCSTTCRACRRGCPTRSPRCPPAPGTPPVPCIPTTTR